MGKITGDANLSIFCKILSCPIDLELSCLMANLIFSSLVGVKLKRDMFSGRFSCGSSMVSKSVRVTRGWRLTTKAKCMLTSYGVK